MEPENAALPTAGMPERWEKFKRSWFVANDGEVIYIFYSFMTFLKLKKEVLKMERIRIQDRWERWAGDISWVWASRQMSQGFSQSPPRQILEKVCRPGCARPSVTLCYVKVADWVLLCPGRLSTGQRCDDSAPCHGHRELVSIATHGTLWQTIASKHREVPHYEFIKVKHGYKNIHRTQ